MSRRTGFTLLEVLVAVALSGAVLLVAGSVMGVAVPASRSLSRHRAELDRRENGFRWLTATLGAIEAGLPGDITFVGSSTRLQATTWFTTPGGWAQRGVLEIDLQDGRVTARGPQGEVLLATGVRGARLAYLGEEGLAAPWLGSWESPASVPRAIRLILEMAADSGLAEDTDTLIVLLGSRG